jgi:O-antigen/teichoic acid export membrane protein
MSFTKELPHNIVYRIINTVVLLIVTVLLSRLMGVAGYGTLSLLIANVTAFNLVSSLGIDSGITYYVSSDKMPLSKIKTVIILVLLMQLLLFAIAELLSFNLNGHFLLFNTSISGYWWIGFSFLLSVSIIEKYTALLNGNHLYTKTNKLILYCNTVLLAFLCFALMYADGRTVYFYIALYAFFSLLQALALVLLYHKSTSGFIYFQGLKKIDVKVFFSYSIIAFITNCIQFLAYRIDYWLINYYRDKTELGWYSLAVRIVQIFWIMPVLFASIVFPVVSSGKTKYSEMLAIIRIMNAVNFFSCFVLFFLAEWLIPLLFGKEFANSASLIRILLPGAFLFCMTTILAAYFAGINKLLINLVGSALCFAIIFGLDLWLIPKFGMYGAAVASSIGYSLTTFYFVVLFYSKSEVSLAQLLFPKKGDWQFIKHLIFNQRTV